MDILNILFWALIITIYFNIGYWGSRSYINAINKIRHNKKLNLFQKFQLQEKWYSLNPVSDSKLYRADTLLSIFFWPVALVITTLFLLFKFIFLGGFFRAIAGLFKKIF
jgi:hypothetical protein